jgi:hypothetical protein
MKNYYVLEIWRDVEPILHGPFPTDTERNDCYDRLRDTDRSGRNGLYVLSSIGRIELA